MGAAPQIPGSRQPPHVPHFYATGRIEAGLRNMSAPPEQISALCVLRPLSASPIRPLRDGAMEGMPGIQAWKAAGASAYHRQRRRQDVAEPMCPRLGSLKEPQAGRMECPWTGWMRQMLRSSAWMAGG